MTATSPFSSVEEGFRWFESFANLERTGRFSEREYQLDRMLEISRIAGDPHRAFRSIHIAGSKGKGSTAAFTASMLSASGLSVGLYTSPHLSDHRERIRRAGDFFDDGILLSAMEEVRGVVIRWDKPEDPPTTFELLTLCAFLTFREAGCAWAVLETGLGGRLDATNIVTPEACILTPVELEHTDVLGDTIEKIAAEKAGIIKTRIPVFLGLVVPEAERVFRKKAQDVDSPLFSLREELESLRTETSLSGTDIHALWKNGETLNGAIPLPGAHQGENACLAAWSIRTLRKNGILTEITDETIKQGLAGARLPGRFEILETSPLLVIDTAHTPASTERTVRTLTELTDRRGILIFGAVAGKDVSGMARLLVPHFTQVIVSRPGYFKQNDPEAVAGVFRQRHERVTLETEPDKALALARRLSGGKVPILVTGSFYMAAEIRKLLVTPIFKNITDDAPLL